MSDREDFDKERRQADRRHSTTAVQERPSPTMERSPQTDIWPEMSQMHERFREIEAEFLEDPKRAVKDAEKLVEEAMNRMMKAMQEQVHSMHGDAENGDTERLRMVMLSYRDFIDSLPSHGANRMGT